MKALCVVLVTGLAACSSAYESEIPAPTFRDDDRPKTPSSNETVPVERPNVTSEEAPFEGVYITSGRSLHRFDVVAKTVRRVGDYDCIGTMNDIAIDHEGHLYGVGTRGTTESLVVRIDPATAKCIEHQAVGDFNLTSLAAIPARADGSEALVSCFDAKYVGVDIGLASLSLLGSVDLRSMGFVEDIVSVPESGVFAVDHSITTNAKPRLVRIDPATGAAKSVVGFIDSTRVTGLAFWKGTLYGVTSDRHVIAIDPTTAAKTDVTVDIEAGDDDFSGATATAASVVR